MAGEETQRVHCGSAEETSAVGERLGRGLPRRYPRGVTVLLVGPLGAGKTVMAQGIARGLGVTDPVISPTYTIISEYTAPGLRVHHVDLYRIEGRAQVENLGLDDIMRDGGVVMIEWGEKLEALRGGRLDGEHVRVTIAMAPGAARDITIEERTQ